MVGYYWFLRTVGEGTDTEKDILCQSIIFGARSGLGLIVFGLVWLGFG